MACVVHAKRRMSAAQLRLLVVAALLGLSSCDLNPQPDLPGGTATNGNGNGGSTSTSGPDQSNGGRAGSGIDLGAGNSGGAVNGASGGPPIVLDPDPSQASGGEGSLGEGAGGASDQGSGGAAGETEVGPR